VDRKRYQLTAEIYRGINIKPADGNSVDSYVGVEFGQLFSKTDPIMRDLNPQYMSRVYVPVVLPAVTDNIAFRISDFNYI
jgi:hypothetical protein